MSRIILEGLSKRFGKVAAIDGVSLCLEPGELTCILGPPGAGKTTLARLVAGLEPLDDGEIYVDQRMVHKLPPADRGVGLVFHDFALWPRLSVLENVAYPLRARRIAKPDRLRRVAETLSLLRIDSLANRDPSQLAPPQRLRVALARSIIAQPQLLILDEPFARLDDRLREEHWEELRRLRTELGLTTLLLTRSVADALAHSSRLAVMDQGRILQAGTPDELYNHPHDAFVARLLGPTNLLHGQIDGGGGESRREVVVRTPLGRLIARAGGGIPPAGSQVTICIRPETLSLGPSIPPDWNRFPGIIERIVFRGEVRQVDLRGPGDWPISARIPQNRNEGVREGQSLTVSVAPDHVHLLSGQFAVGPAS
jgi:ABC-type Fe3+/spermidine/putrescine transport system ATPase subunit